MSHAYEDSNFCGQRLTQDERKMTGTKRPTGIIVPCITPFDERGDLDEETLRAYLDFLTDKTHGISVGAIYGSGLLMSLGQRKRLLEIASEVIGERALFSAFVGAPDTDTAVELARHAARLGADLVTCVQPFYYRHVDKALYGHYMALVGAVPIPVYAYDSPVYAGNRLSIPLLQELIEGGLAGLITGAAGDGIEHLWTCLRTLDRNFSILAIRDGLALPALLMGATGFESGVANYFPELVMEFYRAAAAGEWEKAALLQGQILQLRDISHLFGKNIPTLHALVGMRGLETGVPRRPFYRLAEEEVTVLRERLQALDFATPLS